MFKVNISISIELNIVLEIMDNGLKDLKEIKDKRITTNNYTVI